VFGLIDEGERDRMREPGLRGIIEVLKSRVSVSGSDLHLLRVADKPFQPSGRWAAFETVRCTSSRGVAANQTGWHPFVRCSGAAQ
jgi:hypothetical protein